MRTLIIDDEKHCRDTLSIMLARYCPDLKVLDQCADGASALASIRIHRPELIFLDIEMSGMNGFELLGSCRDCHFEVIFTTAYNEYAIQAIRHRAVDYLLKPIIPSELGAAVERAINAKHRATLSNGIAHLLHCMERGNAAGRITLSTTDGVIIVNTTDILYCEAENNYTRFHLTSGKPIFIAKTLKKAEEQLSPHPDFVRVHQSFIVNMKYVHRYVKGSGAEIILTNEKSIPVSRAKRQELLDRLERM
jgi:two-component system LytT family response regulator